MFSECSQIKKRLQKKANINKKAGNDSTSHRNAGGDHTVIVDTYAKYVER
jgi:hypothetical protein